MRNIIVGTAGHIDHGKTALVRALTGIETDRLEEEKRRGISIDLGFAHLSLDGDVRLGFVDVPGHERFVKNMLAGAGGVDLLLLVIAADESIKPQTREHFDICRLLGIQRGIIVLTKADLVDADLLGLAKLEAEEFVQASFLEGAPVVAVSSRTGQGIEELKRLLREQALETEEKSSAGHFRLPVDRVFTMKGFGTVVTGTLISGAVAGEQEVEVQPGGKKARVRGIQVHGAEAEKALAGQRTALNLAGMEPEDLRRGAMLVEKGRFEATTMVDCEIEMLSSAKPLKHRAPVHFHAWTAEVEAQVRLLEGPDAIAPGGKGFARLLLRDPVQLLPGDRFIVRMFSPVVTIGGGRVLEIAPPPRMRRAQVRERLEVFSKGTARERVERLAMEARYGISFAELVSRTGLAEANVADCRNSPKLVHFAEPQDWLIDGARMQSLVDKLLKMVSAFHRQNPLLPGISKQELRSREFAQAPAFLMDTLLKRSRTLVSDGELLRLASHKLNLRQEEEEAVGKMEKAFHMAGLEVPALKAVLMNCGVEPAKSRSLLQILLREGRLVRVSEDLVFHRDAMESLKQMMARHKGERFAVPAFKSWTGISRKYAIPLLEYLDRERVTRREGDERLVL